MLKAQVKVLQAQLKDAQQQLGYNQIVAPVSGRIGKRSVEVGARVQPGQQLAAIVQDDVWVTANFKETQLPGLVPGQEVKIDSRRAAGQGTGRPRGQLLAGLGQPVRAAAGR